MPEPTRQSPLACRPPHGVGGRRSLDDLRRLCVAVPPMLLVNSEEAAMLGVAGRIQTDRGASRSREGGAPCVRSAPSPWHGRRHGRHGRRANGRSSAEAGGGRREQTMDSRHLTGHAVDLGRRWTATSAGTGRCTYILGDVMRGPEIKLDIHRLGWRVGSSYR